MVARKQIVKPVQDNLHHALACGRKPEISFVIRQNLADVVVHRIVIQHMQAVIVQNADSVSAAEPESLANLLQALDFVEGCGVGFFRVPKAFRHASVVQGGFSRPKVYVSGAIRVRENDMDILDRVRVIPEEACQFSAAECENLIRVSDAVYLAVAAPEQFFYINAFQFGIFQACKLQVPVNGHNAFRCSDINPAVSVFGNGTDFCRGKPFRQAPVFQAAALHQQNAVVVGADPQALPAVNKKADHAGNPRAGVYTDKIAAVIAYKPAVAADPDEAVVCLGNGVGLRCRHAVAAVIEDSGAALGIPDRIHRLSAFFFGLRLSLAEAGCRTGEQGRQKKDPAEEKPRS